MGQVLTAMQTSAVKVILNCFCHLEAKKVNLTEKTN